MPKTLIYKDLNISIHGLNTHLHHTRFDRTAEKGYKYNYIHCLCTTEDAELLQSTFKSAKFFGGNFNTKKYTFFQNLAMFIDDYRYQNQKTQTET